MSKKQSLLLCYALVLSIVVIVAGFLGFGIRAFASAGTSYSIFLTLFGILLMTVPLFFILRRPPQHENERALVSIERREMQLSGLPRIGEPPVASETLRG